MRDPAPVSRWVADPPGCDVEAALRRLSLGDDVQAVAVMPDVHLAGDVCIGTVVATHGLIYPAAVGGDIGCGIAALRFDGEIHLVDERIAGRVLAGMRELVPVTKHRKAPEPEAGLWSKDLSAGALLKHRDRDGLMQLGTLGRGNHFVEIQIDEKGCCWLMVHSGSRAMGQRIRDHHLENCTTGHSGFRCLDADKPSGRAYLTDLEWALEYAKENRRRVVDAAADVIETVSGCQPELSTYIDCHHNHVTRIDTCASALWVHRKGAISARDGEPGIIPGSMGDPSYHVVGRGHPDALWSSSHGAGRRMSRQAARKRISIKALERQAKGVWFDRRIAHRFVDEAPAAYKDITRVMRAQRALTRIVRRLVPILSYKGP